MRFHGPNRPSAAIWAEKVTTLHRVVPNRRARLLGNCCPVPQGNACSFILARHISCRNKIPTVGVLRCPVLITTFNKASGPKLTVVSRKPCGSLDRYPFTIQARSARAAKFQEGHLHTELQRGVHLKSGKTLASDSFFPIVCRSAQSPEN